MFYFTFLFQGNDILLLLFALNKAIKVTMVTTHRPNGSSLCVTHVELAKIIFKTFKT